jgi:hypothetical protein
MTVQQASQKQDKVMQAGCYSTGRASAAAWSRVYRCAPAIQQSGRAVVAAILQCDAASAALQGCLS